MKTSHKILLGLATLLQLVGFGLFFGVSVYVLVNAPRNAGVEYFQGFVTVMNLIGLLFSAYCMAILVIFIVHATRNRNIEETGMRTTWILLLILLGPLAMPFYWFHHIWRDPGQMTPRRGPLGLN